MPKKKVEFASIFSTYFIGNIWEDGIMCLSVHWMKEAGIKAIRLDSELVVSDCPDKPIVVINVEDM